VLAELPLPGQTTRFTVIGALDAGPADFSSPAVLRSANDLTFPTARHPPSAGAGA
jgi:hypothetical protein